MRRTDLLVVLIPLICVGAGVVALIHSWPGPFPGCSLSEIKEGQKAAVEQASDIVKWGLGIAVSICGLYGSLLLRIKSSPGFTLTGNLLATAIILCFAFSAYFALIWRQQLVEVLYQDCVGLISHPWLTRPFNAFTDFFVAGLGLIALMAVVTMISPRSAVSGGG